MPDPDEARDGEGAVAWGTVGRDAFGKHESAEDEEEQDRGRSADRQPQRRQVKPRLRRSETAGEEQVALLSAAGEGHYSVMKHDSEGRDASYGIQGTQTATHTTAASSKGVWRARPWKRLCQGGTALLDGWRPRRYPPGIMSVTNEQVRHIAKLARIAMSDEEIERLAPELNNILGWVEQLGEVNTDGVEPLTAVIDQKLRLRDDVVTDGNIRDDVLANAPDAQHGFFAVPKVIE